MIICLDRLTMIIILIILKQVVMAREAHPCLGLLGRIHNGNV